MKFKKKIHKIMTLYVKIKYELMLRNETVEDLLKATKLSPATISNIKKSRPRFNTYALLAEYFNLELLDLYLLPIKREDILNVYSLSKLDSQYDVMETVNQSEVLPLPEGITMKQYLKQQREDQAKAELLQFISEQEGREVTWDEFIQRLNDEGADSFNL